MKQYLIILLDNSSVSFCHYPKASSDRVLIPIDTLKLGILYAMKENLNIQFVYPDYELPTEYIAEINKTNHTDIYPSTLENNADVVVIDSFNEIKNLDFKRNTSYVLRTDKKELFAHYDELKYLLTQTDRLNVILTDIDTFSSADFEVYKDILARLSDEIESMYVNGKNPQLNLLTDRMILTQMNNCGAGDTTITLAPDGKFYICPAFYMSDDGYDIGSLTQGLNIKNQQLYCLDHAPICRHCDAWQCKRCVWLNRKMTFEVNTPSHEQCVISHLERNASRQLFANIRKKGEFLANQGDIPEISFLDPYENVIKMNK